MSGVFEWLLKVILAPAFIAWVRDFIEKLEEDAEFQAKAKQAVEAYENASTRDEKRAARRRLMDL